MSQETFSIMMNILPIVIAFFTFLVVISSAKVFHPQEAIVETYERVNGWLHKSKTGLFDYEKTQNFLCSHGALFHQRWLTPIKYLMGRLMLAGFFFVIGVRFHAILALVLMIIGFFIPWYLVYKNNKKDNQIMTNQIMEVYNILMIQIRSGVQLTNVLAVCYQGLEPGRLRTGLQELSGDIYLKADFDEAIRNFNSKFENSFIDSLCVILQQARESGKIVEVLNDLSGEIRDMKISQQNQKKGKLDRQSSFCILGLVAVFMMIIIYALVLNIIGTASNF